MPASSLESLVHVGEKLRSSFADGTHLDHLVASASKQILLQKIDFKPAEKPYSIQLDSLKSKYIHLNPGQSSVTQSISNASKNSGGTMTSKDGGDGLPSPKVVLYPEEKVRLDWRKVHRVGSGLHNMGNTCFLNSTLQCLTYTPPLVNFCLSEEHSNSCKQQGFCMMCELQRHIRRCYNNNGHAIKPQAILQKLKMIAKHMHWGRQEDAHEFLRYVVDGLQKACLNGFSKLDKFSKETTIVNQIFGGFLRSQVQCMKCKERSNTYDPVLDISLDIKNVQTVERAFEKFVQPETLDSENAYMCPRCKQKVTAQKRFTIHKPPNVLTLQLKRFDVNRVFGKISSNVRFQDTLNLRPYMSHRQGEPVLYQLYAVLVHSGSACNMGHYYCYVKSSSQSWYCMNDATVQQVNSGRVFNAEAYLLFYIKVKGGMNHNNNNNSLTKLKSPVIGPQLPNKHHNHASSLNGKLNGPSKELGTPVQRKDSSKHVHPVIINEDGKRRINPSSIPPPEKRSKVCFGIRPAAGKDSAGEGDTQTKPENKPRIVMQIKNGKVTTFETSPNGKAKLLEKDTSVKYNKLVPYTEDSDSEKEVRKSEDKSQVSVSAGVSQGEPSSKPKDNNLPSTGNINSSVIFDKKLNATTSVPGNAHLLESPKDKFQTNHQKKVPETGPNGNGLPVNVQVIKGKELTLKFHTNPSPTKHPELDPLTCVTSPSKINATTSWQVQNQDNVLSPSLGSTTSSASVNSTTDWQIKDNSQSSKAEKDRPCSGWTITRDNKSEHGKQSVAEEHEKLTLQSVESLSIKSEKAEFKSVEYSTIHIERHKHSTGVASLPYKSCNSPAQTESVEISDKQPLLNGYLDSDEERAARKKHKKAKKHKKHKVEKDDLGYEKLSNESPGKKSKKKKKKKNKHREKNERSSNDDVSEHEDSPEYEWVEKTVDPKPEITKDSTHSGITKDNTHSGITKDNTHFGITKDNTHSGITKDNTHSGITKDNTHSGITKDNTHSGITKDNTHSGITKDNTHSGITKDNTHSGITKDNTHSGITKDNTHSGITKDNTHSGITKDKAHSGISKDNTHSGTTKDNTHCVQVKKWDEGVIDHHKTSNGHSSNNGVDSGRSTWDGSKSSSVVTELEKHSSSRGYGASVFSWDGERSEVDKAVSEEDDETKKRRWSDEYEEELDSGKRKKLKKHRSDVVVMGYAANPFQKQQDDRNRDKGLWKSASHSHQDNSHGFPNGSSGHHSHDSHGSHSWHNGGSSHHHSHHHTSKHHHHHH